MVDIKETDNFQKINWMMTGCVIFNDNKYKMLHFESKSIKNSAQNNKTFIKVKVRCNLSVRLLTICWKLFSLCKAPADQANQN